jgi:hypothetical protein
MSGPVSANEQFLWDSVGPIEAGKYADLVAAQGDPLNGIGVLQEVKFLASASTGRTPRRIIDSLLATTELETTSSIAWTL